jgi:hypothetical protein
MNRFKNKIYCSDVDDTLFCWKKTSPCQEEVTVTDELLNVTYKGYINRPMVEMIKSKWSRGCHVFVWSQSGEAWANAVVKALGLSEYVFATMEKPESVGDDLPVEKWMSNRVYLPPDHPWRNIESVSQTITPPQEKKDNGI